MWLICREFVFVNFLFISYGRSQFIDVYVYKKCVCVWVSVSVLHSWCFSHPFIVENFFFSA